jgi:hypothetical protein
MFERFVEPSRRVTLRGGGGAGPAVVVAMERLDRMFMEAAARAAAASTRAPAGGDAEGEDEAEADLSAADHILRACAKGDVFAALALPAPACDDAGRPVWDVTDKEMSKAFRKRSLAVHPDKNPAPEAKRAFDKLNDAIRVLRDPVTRGEALRKFAEEAFKKRCRLHPELTAAAKRKQAKRDASEYGDEIVRQQREHRERQLAARERAHQSLRKRKARDASSSESGESEDSESDSEPPPAKASARGDDSDASDDAGLAAPVLGVKRGGRGGRGRGRGPRFI